MKAISFLGFNPKGYNETTYLNPLDGAGVNTKFFQEALVEFYKPQQLYVLLTKTAETKIPEGASESTWESLRKKLESKVDLHPITNVPEGHQQADVWTIFNKLTGCLQDNDCVLFDITHGFRSLPVLALIAVNYLRVARNVSLEGLIYGAFDARDQAKNETPVYDLKPIIELLNWTTATDQFLKTGNAKSLADLLQPQARPLAENISNISQSLHLLRPHEVMKAATDLPREIKNVEAQVETKIPPFALLMQRIEQSYGKFGIKKISDDRERLIRQLEIAEWYKTKGQLVHALSIAREWLPSLLCYGFKIDSLDKNIREKMESLLSGSSSVQISGTRYEWGSIAHGARLRPLWNNPFKLANLRNDVLHAGFSQNPRSADEVAKQTEEVLNEVREIARLWNLL